ncbi:SLATT domain-containing protein [Nocardioides speluncae]|uniref:SLATT domain-containing protein n=1 Tax=Nocardioides speluncae TaxID=2670337 RepID=UPI0019812539|nr:SLATT domain-containing protein [Nocardioides speluncae]
MDNRTGLSPEEALVAFRDLVSADMDWADSRKTRFRRSAAVVRILALGMTALSTVILGISAIPNRASWALPLVASVTLLGGLDAFFNWRSRWVLMEETLYRMNRLRDEIDFLLVTGDPAQVTREQLERFFADQQAIWSDVSRRWVEFRRTSQAGDSPPAIPSSDTP